MMANKQNSSEQPYSGDRNTDQNGGTDNVNNRNNNVDVDVSTPGLAEVNTESANDAGIGDTAVDDQKLTSFTQNHSADA